MEENKRKKSLLGDKFDEADFPFEPSAWTEMATLLADEKEKPPLSKFWKWGWFLAFLFVGLGLWAVSATSSGGEAAHKKEKNTDVLYNEKMGKSNPKTSKAGNQGDFYSKNIEKDSFGNKTVFRNTIKEVPKEDTHSLVQAQIKSGTAAQISNNTSIEKTEKTSIKTQQNRGSDLQFKSEPQSVTQSNNSIETTENKTTNTQAGVNNPSEITDEGRVVGNESATQNIDNQQFAKSDILKRIEDLGFLEQRDLNEVHSMIFKNFDEITHLSETLDRGLIPLSKLWSGRHHQLNLGFGVVLNPLNNNPPPTLDRFSLTYTYRLTPLLGLNATTNYSINNPNGYMWAMEGGLNLYFIHRKKFDFSVMAGYGYRKWDFETGYYGAKERAIGQGRGISLGMNAQYHISPKYAVGLCFDLKSVTHGGSDYGLMLTLGRRF
jgi:hypothetical protein